MSRGRGVDTDPMPDYPDSDDEDPSTDDDTDDDDDEASRPRFYDGPRESESEDEFEVFQWSKGDTYLPYIPEFEDPTAGIQPEFPCSENSDPVDFFMAFFDEELMQLVCDETNKFEQYRQRTDSALNPSLNQQDWKIITPDELYIFFGLTLLMPHIKKHVLKDYWALEDPVATPIFNKFMARDRYTNILSNLHLADNDNPSETDSIWKMREVFDMLKRKFSKFFRPFQKVNIDESLILFRGRFTWRQYIPSKRHRWGIKFFVICDCETGYILDLAVYTGAEEGDMSKYDPHKFSGSVVKNLIDRYYGGNHILYTDNYYTSPNLTKYLIEHGIATCGTVRPNRKNMPAFQTRPKPEQGTVQLQKTDLMLAIRWHDKKEVNLLTTIHKGKLIDSGKLNWRTNEKIFKPDTVCDYNINMRLVDKSDMMVGEIDCLRKCCKWYKKAFFHLLDLSVLNAFNLWKIKTGKYMSLRLFTKSIFMSLFKKFGVVQSIQGRRFSSDHQPDRLLARDFISRHFIDGIPPQPHRPNFKGQRRCHVCASTTRQDRKKKTVTTWCPECETPLCLRCFRDYHTLNQW